MKRGLEILLMFELVSLSISGPTPLFLGYQDSLGQYKFGYSAPGLARSEVRSADGVTTGTFSYIDGAGVIQSARYEADSEGFRIAATNLPEAPLPVSDTPEVVAARNKHLKALALAAQLEEEEARAKEHISETKSENIDQTISEEAEEEEKELHNISESSATSPEMEMTTEELMPIAALRRNYEGATEDIEGISIPEQMMMMHKDKLKDKPDMTSKEEDLMKQELLARNAQMVNLPQHYFTQSESTPAHTTLIKIASSEFKSNRNDKDTGKIMNRIAPKETDRGKNKAKISNKIAPKGMNAEDKGTLLNNNFALIRPSDLPKSVQAPIFTPVTFISFGHPYPYNFGYLPYRYESYLIV